MKHCSECTERTVCGRGLCSRCYQRVRKAGALDNYPTAPKTPEVIRQQRVATLFEWERLGKPVGALKSCDSCLLPFLPRRKNQKHCSKLCFNHHRYLRVKPVLKGAR